MARILSYPFNQCVDIGDSFVAPGNYTTKFHQQVAGMALQFCNTQNRLHNEGWKFSCTKANPIADEKEGILVRRVPMDYKRGDDVATSLIRTDAMASIRSDQWARIAFVLEQVAEQPDPLGYLMEQQPPLRKQNAKMRGWACGNGTIGDEDEAIIAMMEKAISD